MSFIRKSKQKGTFEPAVRGDKKNRVRVNQSGLVISWDEDKVYRALRKWCKRYVENRLGELRAIFGPVSSGVESMIENSGQALLGAQHLMYLVSLEADDRVKITHAYLAIRQLKAESRNFEKAAMEMAVAEQKANKKPKSAHDAINEGLATPDQLHSLMKDDVPSPFGFNDLVRTKKGRPKKNEPQPVFLPPKDPEEPN